MNSRYKDFTLQYIAGHWRAGASKSELTSSDPYTGEHLVTLPMATIYDVDSAYEAARRAQPVWTALLPSERASVLRKVVAIFDERRDEIVDWLIRESGSTRIKAEIEWGLARTITEELAKAEGARVVVAGPTVGSVMPPHVFADVLPGWKSPAMRSLGHSSGYCPHATMRTHSLERRMDRRCVHYRSVDHRAERTASVSLLSRSARLLLQR